MDEETLPLEDASPRKARNWREVDFEKYFSSADAKEYRQNIEAMEEEYKALEGLEAKQRYLTYENKPPSNFAQRFLLVMKDNIEKVVNSLTFDPVKTPLETPSMQRAIKKIQLEMAYETMLLCARGDENVNAESFEKCISATVEKHIKEMPEVQSYAEKGGENLLALQRKIFDSASYKKPFFKMLSALYKKIEPKEGMYAFVLEPYRGELVASTESIKMFGLGITTNTNQKQGPSMYHNKQQ
jgi:hypothetical protein